MSERPDSTSRPDPATPWLVVLVAWLAFFLVSFDYTAASVALPSLTETFGVGTSMISWISLIYFLAIAGLVFPASMLLNSFGYRKSLLWAFLVFAAASLGCALSADLLLLLVFRAAQGTAATVLYVAGPMMIRGLIPEESRNRAYALFAAAGPAGISAGPAIGGLVTSFAGGQMVFLANLPPVALAVWLLLRRPSFGAGASLPGDRPGLAGLALIVLSSVAVVLALNQGREWGWSSVAIVSLFAVGVAALVGFVVEERHAARPLIPPEIFAVRPFRLGNLVFLFVLIPFGGLVFLLPFYLEWYRGYTPHGAGLLLTVQALSTVAASVACGWLPQRISLRVRLSAAVVLMACGMIVLAILRQPGSIAPLIVSLVAIGGGSGVAMSTTMQVVMGHLPEDLTGTGSAVQSQVRTLAQLLGVVLFETVFSQVYVLPSSPAYGAATSAADLATILAAFRYALVFGLVCLLLAQLPIWRIPDTLKTQDNARTEEADRQ